MTQHQHGFADNYAGVARMSSKTGEWLAGWDEAQLQRLGDEREIRSIARQLGPEPSHMLFPEVKSPD